MKAIGLANTDPNIDRNKSALFPSEIAITTVSTTHDNLKKFSAATR